MKLVLIGNGPAAIHAIEAIRKKGRNCSVTMVAKEPERTYNPCFLAHYVSGEMTRHKLYTRSPSFYKGIKTLFGIVVTDIMPGRAQIMLSHGKTIHYDKLLIAAGASALIPKIPEITGKGVFTFKTIADADKIIAASKEAHHAVVMGGAFIGLEIAEALRKRRLAVVVVERENRVLPRMLDADMSRIVHAHIQGKGIRLITGTGVRAVERGRDKNIRAVILESGERLPCDLLVVASGSRPNLDMIKNSGIRTETGIIVDKCMHTNLPYIFAAGDIAELILDKTTVVNPIHVAAVRGGQIAGWNMMGINRQSERCFDFMNVVNLFGLSVLSVGVKRGANTITHRDKSGTRKFYLGEDGALKGAQLIGDVSKGGIYLSLIRKSIPIAGKRELLSPHLNYGLLLPSLARR